MSSKMDKIFSPIKERCYTFIEYKGISKEKFFEKTEISPSNFKGNGAKSELGGEKIVKILSEFPEINPKWLLTGVGNMLQKESDQFTNQAQNKQSAPHCQHCISKDLRITDLSKTIQIQDKLIESLEREIKHFKPPD
jgi:hypothetical protein